MFIIGFSFTLSRPEVFVISNIKLQLFATGVYLHHLPVIQMKKVGFLVVHIERHIHALLRVIHSHYLPVSLGDL